MKNRKKSLTKVEGQKGKTSPRDKKKGNFRLKTVNETEVEEKGMWKSVLIITMCEPPNT